MKEFLQDHMYSREYEIQYDDVDVSHELTATSVLKYLEDRGGFGALSLSWLHAGPIHCR